MEAVLENVKNMYVCFHDIIWLTTMNMWLEIKNDHKDTA